MSTIILGRLAKPSGPAYARALDENSGDQKKHWAEALAAVVPGEALAAYSAFISFFTVNAATGDAAASLTKEGWVKILSLGVLLAIPIVYAASSGALLGKGHIVRWSVAMVAFLAWLWLLPLSVWDTLIHVDRDIRAASGIVIALIIISSANFAFKKYQVP